MRDKTFIVGQLILLVMLTISAITIYSSRHDCDTCDMRFNRTSGNSINGVYSSEGYYCIWTEGRTLQEIMIADRHELQHYMNDKELEHFGGEE